MNRREYCKAANQFLPHPFLLVRSISRRKGWSVTGVNSIDLKES